MISVVVLTKNNESSIEETIRSLSWVTDVVIVDDNSTDSTVKIAKKTGAQVYVRSLKGDYSAQRNFGLQKSTQPWVLFLDSDETISKDVQHEIEQAVTSTDMNGFYLRRQDVFVGKKLRFGETANVRLLRLGRKDAGKFVGAVHEVWQVKGKTAELKSPLLHYPHPTIADFITTMNTYSTLRAKELYEHKARSYWWHFVVYPVAKFLKNYIWYMGFRDGIHGFVHALLMAWLHSFLVRGKLWLLYRGIPQHNEQQLDRFFTTYGTTST